MDTAWISNKLSVKQKYKYLFLALCFGVLLMLFPAKVTSEDITVIDNENGQNYSIEREEKRLEELLSAIEGVGECKVLLSVHNGAEKILARDEGETVVISESGRQSTVTVQTRYPEFQGAVIVCKGCDIASVRYDILASVMAYTGLSNDRISICPINE